MVDRFEILGVRAADGGARLVITLKSVIGGEEKRESMILFSTHLSRIPQTGEIPRDVYEALRRKHELGAALDTGLRSLAASGGSRVQLQQKLCARGIANEIAQNASRELCEKGYLQETENALACAKRDLRKLWGDRRILADLRAKGYGEDAIFAVREMLENEDAVQRCAKLLEKRALAELDEAQLQKLIASLMRYGYTRAEIRAALRESMDK